VLILALACNAPGDTGSPTTTCPEGQLLDGVTCVPEACGVGPFGDRDGQLYVDPLNLGEEDGSPETPFREVNAALLKAPEDATVVLASGTHKGLIRMDLAARGVKLVGRCKELTVLDGDGELVTVYGQTTGTHVEQVTITGAVEAGVFSSNETVVLRDVDMDRPGYVGFWVLEQGEALLERVQIRDPIEDPKFESAWGVAASEGSTLVLRDVLVENAIDAGVFLEGSGAVDAERLTVLDTSSSRDGNGSSLVSLSSGPIHLKDSTFVGSQLAGLTFEPGSTALVENCHIEAARPASADYVYAAGVLAVDSEVTIRDTTIHDIHGTGAEIFGASGRMVLERVDIVDVSSTDKNFASGFGVTVRHGTLEAHEVTLTNTTAVGAWASDAGTLFLNDVLIDGVVPSPSASAVAGVYATYGAHVEMDGVEVRNLAGNGISMGPSSTLVAKGVDLHHISPNDDLPGSGRCIEIENATAQIQDSLLRECHEVAVLASGLEADVTLAQVTIQDIAPTPTYPFGLGLLAQHGALMTGHQVDVSGTTTAAGAAVLEGHLTLTDSALHDSLLNANHALGYAVVAGNAGSVTLENTEVQTAGLAGLLSSGHGSAIHMSGGHVQGVYVGIGADTAFGALTQDAGHLELNAVTFDDIQGPGIACSSAASVTGQGVSITNSRFAGVVLQGCTSNLQDLYIEDITRDPQAGGGVGVFIDGYGHGPGTETLDQVQVRGAPMGGVVGQGAGTWSLTSLDLHGGEGLLLAEHTLNGHGLLLKDCGSVVADGELAFSRAGLFLHGCSPQLGELDLHDNDVDLHQQACEEPVAVPDGVSFMTCPNENELLTPLTFNAALAEPALSP